VRYLINAHAVRKKWYNFDVRLNEIFPVLPYDRTPVAVLPLPIWLGNWRMHQHTEKVRKGLFSSSGQVTAQVREPYLGLSS